MKLNATPCHSGCDRPGGHGLSPRCTRLCRTRRKVADPHHADARDVGPDHRGAVWPRRDTVLPGGDASRWRPRLYWPDAFLARRHPGAAPARRDRDKRPFWRELLFDRRKAQPTAQRTRRRGKDRLPGAGRPGRLRPRRQRRRGDGIVDGRLPRRGSPRERDGRRHCRRAGVRRGRSPGRQGPNPVAPGRHRRHGQRAAGRSRRRDCGRARRRSRAGARRGSRLARNALRREHGDGSLRGLQGARGLRRSRRRRRDETV